MKTNVYSSDGKSIKEIKLPELFSEAYREDLIKRAVLSDESREYQPKGAYRWAGLETGAKYRGRKEMFGAVKNKGIAHLPHEVLPKGQLGKVKRVPQSVKGRRAHPPKPQKILIEEMNHKEYVKALKSALAATANKNIVNGRCNMNFDVSLPIILDNSFENLKKTKDVVAVFNFLKLSGFVSRSKKNGVKGPLVIINNSSKSKAANNIAGVDVVSSKNLKVKHLAPGCKAGRLTIFTENSLSDLQKMFQDDKVVKQKSKGED